MQVTNNKPRWKFNIEKTIKATRAEIYISKELHINKEIST